MDGALQVHHEPERTWEDYDNDRMFCPWCGVIRDGIVKFEHRQDRPVHYEEVEGIGVDAVLESKEFVENLSPKEKRLFAEIIEQGNEFIEIIKKLDSHGLVNKSHILHECIDDRPSVPKTLYTYCSRMPIIKECSFWLIDSSDWLFEEAFDGFSLLVKSGDGEFIQRTGTSAIIPLLEGMRFIGTPDRRVTNRGQLRGALKNINKHFDRLRFL